MTALNPIIGCDKATEIAKQACADGQRIKDVAARTTTLSREELDRLLEPGELTRGGIERGLTSG